MYVCVYSFHGESVQGSAAAAAAAMIYKIV